MKSDQQRLIVKCTPDRIEDEQKTPTSIQQCPFVKFALVDSPNTLVVNFVANFDKGSMPDPNLQYIDQVRLIFPGHILMTDTGLFSLLETFLPLLFVLRP